MSALKLYNKPSSLVEYRTGQTSALLPACSHRKKFKIFLLNILLIILHSHTQKMVREKRVWIQNTIIPHNSYIKILNKTKKYSANQTGTPSHYIYVLLYTNNTFKKNYKNLYPSALITQRSEMQLEIFNPARSLFFQKNEQIFESICKNYIPHIHNKNITHIVIHIHFSHTLYYILEKYTFLFTNWLKTKKNSSNVPTNTVKPIRRQVKN